jgi:prepilin-type processing-associated H-X9-DG protein
MAFYHSPGQINAMGQAACTYSPAKVVPSTAQKLAAIRYPEKKVLAGEWTDNHQYGTYTWWSWVGARQYLFADGHVTYLQARDLRPANDGFPDPNLTRDGASGKDLP